MRQRIRTWQMIHSIATAIFFIDHLFWLIFNRVSRIFMLISLIKEDKRKPFFKIGNKTSIRSDKTYSFFSIFLHGRGKAVTSRHDKQKSRYSHGISTLFPRLAASRSILPCRSSCKAYPCPRSGEQATAGQRKGARMTRILPGTTTAWTQSRWATLSRRQTTPYDNPYQVRVPGTYQVNPAHIP